MTTDISRAAADVGEFTERVLGFRLFDHQLTFLRSKATYRVICSGRQSGKSRAIAAACLYEAATRANIRVLIVSQSEETALNLLSECATLLDGSPLSGSRLDETKTQLTLSNGSTIKCVPASTRQIRGKSIDLLCMDEAAFIDEAIWQAAEPTMAARPGARAILASTPWGDTEHFYRKMFNRGLITPDSWVESFQWPSTISPLVSDERVEFWRQEWSDYKFRTEILAEWADSQGSLLKPEEISRAIVDYPLLQPHEVDRYGYWYKEWMFGQLSHTWQLPGVVAGVDWGKRQDANALVVVGAVDDGGLNAVDKSSVHDGHHLFYIPYIEEHYNMDYGVFIPRVLDVCRGFNVRFMASELNGVGDFPTEFLMAEANAAMLEGEFPNGKQFPTQIRGVWTDNKRKQQMYGALKGLLQNNQLILPRHPALLKQLAGLTVTQTAAGNTKIEVPASQGHDDLADALGGALSCLGTTIRMKGQRYWLPRTDATPGEVLNLPSGLKVPLPVRPLDPLNQAVFQWGVAGEEPLDKW